MRFLLITLVTLINLISIKSVATTEDSQQWFNITGQGQIKDNSPFGFYLEAQARRSDRSDKFYESIIRPAFIYKTENAGQFFLGTLKRYDTDGKDVETRHWLQWSDSKNSDEFRLSYRLRYEQRDLAHLDQHSNRLRIMGRIVHQKLLLEKLKPFGSLELFYHMNTISPDIKSGLSQTRTALGLTYPINDLLNLDASYQNVYLFNMTRENQMNHVLNFVLNVAF